MLAKIKWRKSDWRKWILGVGEVLGLWGLPPPSRHFPKRSYTYKSSRPLSAARIVHRPEMLPLDTVFLDWAVEEKGLRNKNLTVGSDTVTDRSPDLRGNPLLSDV